MEVGLHASTIGKSLPDRMREAAKVLVEVSELYEAFCPDRYPWSAAELLNEAEHVEAEGL